MATPPVAQRGLGECSPVLGAFAIDSSDHLALNPDLYRLGIALPPQEVLGIHQGIGVRSGLDWLNVLEAIRNIHEEAAIFGQCGTPGKRVQAIGQQTIKIDPCSPLAG
jgi:hypothetical protein